MLVGFHVQDSPNDYLEAVKELAPNSIVKFTSGWERAIEVKAKNPHVKVAVRHVVEQPMPTSNYEQAAREYFRGMVDTKASLWKSVDYIQGWNEFYAESQEWEEKKHWVATDIAFAKVWYDEYRPIFPHIRYVTSEAAVGNSIPWQVAEGAVKYDAAIGYHPYLPVLNKNISPANEWLYYSGRWTVMDNLYRGMGFFVDWFFGEMGPYQSAITGWRHKVVLNRDMKIYKEMLRYWIDRTRGTVAYKQGRVLGGVLFTCGAPGAGANWSWFDHNTAEMKEIAIYVRGVMEEQPPVVPPVEPPVEPPTDSFKAILWQQSIERQTIQLNPVAALQAAIFRDGYVPVQAEFWTTIDGIEYAAQAAEHLSAGSRRVYYAVVPNWNDVRFIGDLNVSFAPTDSTYITQRWGENVPYYLKYGIKTGHNGIDFGADTGEPVYAVASGKVTYAGMDNSGYGNHIIMYNGSGFQTLYAHLSRMAVHEGQQIAAGSLIGYVGNTGDSSGPHLHFEIRKDGKAIDPEPYLESVFA